MKKTTINEVEFCNFGSNLLSNGMELITCYPMPKNMVQDVLDGKYPGVFLNPSAPCREEFYGFLGTKEQYEVVYEEQRESQISKRVLELVDYYNRDPENILVGEWRTAQKEAEEEYKDWWNK